MSQAWKGVAGQAILRVLSGNASLTTYFRTYRYLIRAAAYNRRGTGAFSGTARDSTSPVPPAAPAAPTVRPGSEGTSTSLDIIWVPPVGLGGSSIQEYRISVRECDDKGDWKPLATPLKSTELTLTDLAPARTYAFRVSAKNVAGWSNFSAATECCTTATTPSAPLDLAIESVSSASVTVTWVAPAANGAPIDRFDIEFSPVTAPGATASPPKLLSVDNPETTSFSLTGLDPDSGYCCRVRAVSIIGPGPFSDPFLVKTAPGTPSAPGTVTVCRADITSLELKWTPPVDNGAPLTRYRLQVHALRIISSSFRL